jgi:hypothetical protein
MDDIGPGSPILVTLMEALSSSETSIPTRAMQRNIPEDRENLKSYIDRGNWSASNSCCFTPDTYWTGGWMGCIASLDFVVKMKMLALPGIES